MNTEIIRIFSYNPTSEGAKNLSESTGILRLKHEGSRWNPRGKTLVNWGSSRLPPLEGLVRVVNRPEEIQKVSNKLTFFQNTTEDVEQFLPEWTTDRDEASDWDREGHTVVLRHSLTGHSGEGIELFSGDPGNIPTAPLYTKYFKKISEFRVHIAFGSVIDVQQKKRKTDVPDDEVNWKVRNLAGGFIYARGGVEAPAKVLEAASSVSSLFGLDFGAWDVLYNRTEDKAVVLEVNTAPGISGTTVEKYKAAFEENL